MTPDANRQPREIDTCLEEQPEARREDFTSDQEKETP